MCHVHPNRGFGLFLHKLFENNQALHNLTSVFLDYLQPNMAQHCCHIQVFPTIQRKHRLSFLLYPSCWLSYSQIIRAPLIIVLVSLTNAMVALRRIGAFLTAEEPDEPYKIKVGSRSLCFRCWLERWDEKGMMPVAYDKHGSNIVFAGPHFFILSSSRTSYSLMIPCPLWMPVSALPFSSTEGTYKVSSSSVVCRHSPNRLHDLTVNSVMVAPHQMPCLSEHHRYLKSFIIADAIPWSTMSLDLPIPAPTVNMPYLLAFPCMACCASLRMQRGCLGSVGGW